jgi:uncharacterized membrane protein YdbT with pleckstrin-like domain
MSYRDITLLPKDNDVDAALTKGASKTPLRSSRHRNPIILLQGERLLRKERIHPGVFILPALALLPFLLILLPAWFFIRMLFGGLGTLWQALVWSMILLLVPSFLVVLVAYLKSGITLTNKRLLFRSGLISSVSGELPLENIETISMVEPLLGCLLGYGTITVMAVGGSIFPVPYIAKPFVFHAVLQQGVTAAKAFNAPSAQDRNTIERRLNVPA